MCANNTLISESRKTAPTTLTRTHHFGIIALLLSYEQQSFRISRILAQWIFVSLRAKITRVIKVSLKPNKRKIPIIKAIMYPYCLIKYDPRSFCFRHRIVRKYINPVKTNFWHFCRLWIPKTIYISYLLLYRVWINTIIYETSWNVHNKHILIKVPKYITYSGGKCWYKKFKFNLFFEGRKILAIPNVKQNFVPEYCWSFSELVS